MSDINMRLDANFLSKLGVKIYYIKKKVWFNLDDGDEFIFKESQVLNMMINRVKAKKMLTK